MRFFEGKPLCAGLLEFFAADFQAITVEALAPAVEGKIGEVDAAEF